ncbi:Sec20 [Plasmopara halstedii]|uniref:Sec20 n=1 Tax=Plasmopara halstedii TaxID=4781 RepID=A0A0P1AJ19_PLAHL|nr:Sec20 [Plasmopara halstedii]CEG40513.1 Sec20 [Plasmopara halstedii]|eukprot:XP_024576882.1 Sec20 [Plasmopara halstedii]
MEELEQAEHILGIWRYVSTNLSIRQSDTPSQQRLTFSNEEEQALEAKMSEAINAYRRALTNAHDWIGDMQDSKEAQLVAQKLEEHNAHLHSHMTNCRKVLVAYRQRAKIERIEQQRQSLLPQKFEEANTSKSDSTLGSAVDVTAALKRTRQVMSQEIERASSVTKVLDDGRQSLRSSHEEYGNVNAEIIEVQKRLKALEWQAKQDKMWIGAGMMVLLSTVLFIV